LKRVCSLKTWAIIENVPILKAKSYLNIFFYHMDGQNMKDVTMNVTFVTKCSSSENKLYREDFRDWGENLICCDWNPIGDKLERAYHTRQRMISNFEIPDRY